MAIFIRLLGLMCRGAQHWTDFVVRNAVRNYQEGSSRATWPLTGSREPGPARAALTSSDGRASLLAGGTGAEAAAGSGASRLVDDLQLHGRRGDGWSRSSSRGLRRLKQPRSASTRGALLDGVAGSLPCPCTLLTLEHVYGTVRRRWPGEAEQPRQHVCGQCGCSGAQAAHELCDWLQLRRRSDHDEFRALSWRQQRRRRPWRTRSTTARASTQHRLHLRPTCVTNVEVWVWPLAAQGGWWVS